MRRNLSCGLLLALALPAITAPVLAADTIAPPDQLLPPMGGEGGGTFQGHCREGDILVALDLRTADDVDWVAPVCATVYGPRQLGQGRVTSKGFGGPRGEFRSLRCPESAPVITGLEVGYEGVATVVINNVHLFCGVAVPNQPMTNYPAVVFDGPVIGGGTPLQRNFARCPAGLVAVGITGRSGTWLDALSLICGEWPAAAVPPPIPPTTVVSSIGRVNTGPSTPRRPGTICDAARDALARQSPASPNLVSACRAAGGIAAAVSNADLEAITIRGGVLAANDPMADALRARLPEGAARRGFDIGLGIWDGNTAPGPGKQRYHDALITAEQQGFDIAAAYALPRNKYAGLVSVGAAIAAADPEVSAARVTDPDPFFWLGFDIASGLFGDPAAGSEGHKVVGPGAIALRNSLNAPAQRGFEAAIRLHRARSY